MEAIELHSRGKGWTPRSPSSDGDNISDSEFGKIQAADSADMRRMGKKQEFRVCVMMGCVVWSPETDKLHSVTSTLCPSLASVWL